jgi:hypothetical protein
LCGHDGEKCAENLEYDTITTINIFIIWSLNKILSVTKDLKISFYLLIEMLFHNWLQSILRLKGARPARLRQVRRLRDGRRLP